jgi:hypothetical protein
MMVVWGAKIYLSLYSKWGEMLHELGGD